MFDYADTIQFNRFIVYSASTRKDAQPLPKRVLGKKLVSLGYKYVVLELPSILSERY